MAAFVDHPAVLFIVLLVVLVVAVGLGTYLRRVLPLRGDERDDFNVVQGATLTLLALLIGFSLSMAVNRYDARKNLEESEANAIGTEYARADLAGATVGQQMKTSLVRYTRLRLAHFLSRDAQEIATNERNTADLQSELWGLAVAVANDTDADFSCDRHGHERRAQLTGLFRGCTDQSNPDRRMDIDVPDCDVRVRRSRLRR